MVPIQQQCIGRLHSAFGNEAPFMSVFSKFKRGHGSLTIEFRVGCSRTAAISENIDAVCKMIETTWHGTYREIETFFGY